MSTGLFTMSYQLHSWDHPISFVSSFLTAITHHGTVMVVCFLKEMSWGWFTTEVYCSFTRPTENKNNNNNNKNSLNTSEQSRLCDPVTSPTFWVPGQNIRPTVSLSPPTLAVYSSRSKSMFCSLASSCFCCVCGLCLFFLHKILPLIGMAFYPSFTNKFSTQLLRLRTTVTFCWSVLLTPSLCNSCLVVLLPLFISLNMPGFTCWSQWKQ